MGLLGRAGRLDLSRPEALMAQLLAGSIKAGAEKEAVEEEEELSEDELRRIREIASKFKEEKQTF